MGEVQIKMSAKRGRSSFIVIVLSFLGVLALFAISQNLVFTQSESRTLSQPECFDFNLPDSNVSRAIYLNLKSAIAVDNETGEVLYCYNADEVRPVASISKLLSAMVVLDNYRPDTVITISRQDCRRSGRSIFRAGDKVRMKDLLHAALLKSDNRAARALARAVAGDSENFTEMMNRKAKKLGLTDTEMYEPTGLDERNRSTAADCARLVNSAMLLYPRIADITSLKKYVLKPTNRKRRMRLINTNKMVFSRYKVLAGKTGYIIESDYCLATVLENGQGKCVTVVVLGVPGPQTRFREARRLANYAFRKVG
jgi:D-alanyl-D-alanine endopeptidase (penicillin-binding protein 7)